MLALFNSSKSSIASSLSGHSSVDEIRINGLSNASDSKNPVPI